MAIDRDQQKLSTNDFIDDDEVVKPRKRRRKTIGEEGTRKQVVIGLLITIVLSLFFYLPTEVKIWWSRLNQVEVITIEKPVGDAEDVSGIVGFKVEIKKEEDVVEAIEKLLAGLSGDYGVMVKKVDDSGEFVIDYLDQEKVFEAASVIKLPILAAYYQAVDEGSLDPKETYSLKETDRLVYGTGVIQNQPVGTEYSYQEIAYLTANQSDNMGAQLLIKFLGGNQAVQKMVEAWGLEKTLIKEAETTVKEMGELLEKIYDGDLISIESKQELLENLTNTVLEDRIPAGVPSGIKVAHKFGSEKGVVNDCGIVYSKNPYIICILSSKVADGEAEAVLPKISRLVWEWAGK